MTREKMLEQEERIKENTQQKRIKTFQKNQRIDRSKRRQCHKEREEEYRKEEGEKISKIRIDTEVY